MRYELWLSLKYLFRKRRERFVPVIALLSIGGVALGVAALLVVLSVMSGFDHDLQDKLVGTNAHLTVDAEGGLQHIESMLRTIAATEHVIGVTPFITGQVILRQPDRAFGVVARGIDVEREIRVSRLQEYLVVGTLPTTDRDVVIGIELARSIGVAPGEPLSFISPADGKTYEFVVSGLFKSGMYEYDAGLIGITLARAQQMFVLGDIVSGLSVRLDDVSQAGRIQRLLDEQLGPGVEVKTWMQLNPTLFAALHLEKVVMFIILALIIVVAALNIVSMLIMSVMEKTKDIGVLRSLGATAWSVARVFLFQGVAVGVFGVGLGLAGGLSLAWNLNAIAGWLERAFGIAVFPPTIYYLDRIPAQVNAGDVVTIVAAALGLTLVAGIYPAVRAARLVPVEALRYE